MLDSLSPARRRLVLLLVGAVGVLVLGVVALVVARATTGGATPVAQGDPGPVLLVSGYGGSTQSLEPLRSALEGAGRDVVVVPPVGAGTGDIAVQAQALGEQADAAMQRFGATSVDVVGYSAGGVVAREWVRSFDGAGSARRVLSVGSPQHGTTVAELGAGLGTSVPDRLPAAGPGQPAAARAQRARRDPGRAGVRLGLVEQRRGRRPDRLRPARRAP